jgi:hypothetical protein
MRGMLPVAFPVFQMKRSHREGKTLGGLKPVAIGARDFKFRSAYFCIWEHEIAAGRILELIISFQNICWRRVSLHVDAQELV